MAVLSTGSTNFPTTTSFSGLAAAMKEVYGDYVYDQLSQETTLYQLFAEATDTEIHSGRVFIEAVHTARNRSAGPRPESGTALPGAQTQTYNRFEIPIRRYHAAGGFSAQTLLASARDEGSLVRAMDVEVNGAMNDMKLELEVDLFGRPDAALALVRSVGAFDAGNARTAINVYPAADGNEFGGGHADNQNFLAVAGPRYISKNLQVAIGKPAAATGVIDYRQPVSAVGDPFTVTANPTTNQLFYVSGDQDGQGIVDGDLVMRYRAHGPQANDADDSANNGLYGLEYLVDDGTNLPIYLDNLQGIDRTSDTTLQSVVLDKGGAAAFTEMDIINLVYRIEEASGTYPDLILTTRPGQSALFDLFDDTRRFVPQAFPGGFKGELLTINVGNKDLPIYVAKHAAYRTLYFINLSKMKRYIQTDFHLAEESGSVLERSSTGDDTWVFRIRWHGNVGTVQPNAHGKLIDPNNTQMDQTFGAATPLISF